MSFCRSIRFSQLLHLQRPVELQHGVEAVEPVRLGADRHVVPRRELLDDWPRSTQALEKPQVVAGRLQLLGGLEHLGPGLRDLGDAGLLQCVELTHITMRRRVEGERQHLALRGRVVAGDRRQIGLRIERLAGILHQLIDRLDRAVGGHHGRGADLEHLDDVRRVAGTERRDAGVHGVRIAALVGRDDLVVGLRGVEIVGELVDDVVVAAGHGVPPLDFGDCMRRRGRKCQ